MTLAETIMNELRSYGVKKVELDDVGGGGHVTRAISRGIALANHIEAPITFNFNEVNIAIQEDSNPQLLKEEFSNAVGTSKKSIGPCPYLPNELANREKVGKINDWEAHTILSNDVIKLTLREIDAGSVAMSIKLAIEVARCMPGYKHNMMIEFDLKGVKVRVLKDSNWQMVLRDYGIAYCADSSGPIGPDPKADAEVFEAVADPGVMDKLILWNKGQAEEAALSAEELGKAPAIETKVWPEDKPEGFSPPEGESGFSTLALAWGRLMQAQGVENLTYETARECLLKADDYGASSFDKRKAAEDLSWDWKHGVLLREVLYQRFWQS